MTDTATWKTNDEWECEVTKPSAKYNEFTCSRALSAITDWSLLNINYKTGSIVEPVGYRYNGSVKGTSAWQTNGKVTLSESGGATSLLAGAAIISSAATMIAF